MTKLSILNLVLNLAVSTPLVFFSMPRIAPNIQVQSPILASNIEIASREMSMDYRYPVASVSKVFKDNILLNVAYLDGRVSRAQEIDWTKIDQPFRSEFTLQPNETFAYHDEVLSRYKDKVVVTTNSRFNKQDGYKTDGYLYGDGVCQLASLLNWAARDANLDVYAPANHNFAAIPEVPKEYGVAIFFDPNNPNHSANRNLYITNNQNTPITFAFDYTNGKLKISVTKPV